MDVVGVTEEIELRDVELRHKISMPIHRGERATIYVFIDKSANTYYWISYEHHDTLQEGNIYNLRCLRNTAENNKLRKIQEMSSVQSEQPDKKPDAEDVLLGLKDY